MFWDVELLVMMMMIGLVMGLMVGIASNEKGHEHGFRLLFVVVFNAFVWIIARGIESLM